MPTTADVFVDGVGFALGSEVPALMARCTALGATLVQGERLSLICPLGATTARAAVEVTLAPIPGETVLGYMVISTHAATAAELFPLYDAVRARLVGRFGRPATDIVPRACRSARARALCVARDEFEYASDTWAAPSLGEHAIGDASRLAPAGLESLSLSLAREVGGDTWRASITKIAPGFSDAFMREASR